MLTAVNALDENQREHPPGLNRVESTLQDTYTRVRPVEDNVADIKGPLVRALDR